IGTNGLRGSIAVIGASRVRTYCLGIATLEVREPRRMELDALGFTLLYRCGEGTKRRTQGFRPLRCPESGRRKGQKQNWQNYRDSHLLPNAGVKRRAVRASAWTSG